MKNYELIIEQRQPTCGGRAPTKSEMGQGADQLLLLLGQGLLLFPEGKLRFRHTIDGFRQEL